jgi:hypothetical protein
MFLQVVFSFITQHHTSKFSVHQPLSFLAQTNKLLDIQERQFIIVAKIKPIYLCPFVAKSTKNHA